MLPSNTFIRETQPCTSWAGWETFFPFLVNFNFTLLQNYQFSLRSICCYMYVIPKLPNELSELHSSPLAFPRALFLISSMSLLKYFQWNLLWLCKLKLHPQTPTALLIPFSCFFVFSVASLPHGLWRFTDYFCLSPPQEQGCLSGFVDYYVLTT